MTDANGNTKTTGVLPILAGTATTARDTLYTFLKNNSWAVEKSGDGGIIILGKAEPNGTITVAKTLTWAKTDVTIGNVNVTGFGPVTVNP